MYNVGLFKKISLYLLYKKVIRRNSVEIENKFNMRIDNANRLYTVLNIPEDVFGEAYAIKKSDIDRVADRYVREFSSELGSYLNSKGIEELYDYYDLKKVGKYSYLIIIGFSIFRSDVLRERIYKWWIPGISIAVVASILSVILL
jgi:hypothetical protein